MFKSRRFRTNITFAVILGLVLFAFVMILLSSYFTMRLIRAESEEKLMNIVRIHVGKLENSFSKRRYVAESIKNYIEATMDFEEVIDNPSSLDDYLTELTPFVYETAEGYGSAWIYFNPFLDQKGRDIWFWDQDFDGTPNRMLETEYDYYLDEEGKEWFFTPMKEKKTTWSNPYQTTLLDDKSIYWISHSIPIYNNGDFIGVSGSDFYYTEFLDSFSQLSVYGSGYGVLLNAKNEILIHPDFEDITQLDKIYDGKFHWMAEHLNENETGAMEYEWVDGSVKIMAFSHLSNGWTLAITADKNVIYKTLFRQLSYMIGVTVITIMIASILAHKVVVYLTKRLENLTQVVSATGKGDYESPIAKRYLEDESEVGILATAVEHMRIQQKKSFDEIRDYSNHLEKLVEKRTNELEHSNFELEMSLDELKETQASLVESKKLEAINRFLVEIAHRMNTPLGNAGMTISFMDQIIDDLKKDVGNDISPRIEEELKTLKDSVVIATNGIRTSTEIIRGLKVFSKDLNGTVTDNVNIREMIEVCYREFNNQLNENKSIGLELDCPEGLHLETHPVLLMEALSSLMKYSALYSMIDENKKVIYINVKEENHTIIIEYRDESRLKFTNLKDRVFEPFSITSFENGISGMELHMLFNIVSIGLKGKIDCLGDEEDRPYFTIQIKV